MPPSKSINWMREASRFIRAHRNKTFVVYFGGEATMEDGFDGLIEDLVLLAGLGIKLIVVHGARPQIDRACVQAGISPSFVGDLRVTDAATLVETKRAVLMTGLDISAKLTRAALDTAERSSGVRVSSGNYVIARPRGVVQGKDVGFTGELRRIDVESITRHLEHGEIVLLSPLGYSSSGEVFNLNALELATAVSGDIHADKLLILAECPILERGSAQPISQLTLREAREISVETQTMQRYVNCAIRACQFGVGRVHLIERQNSGALLDELFTRDGSGTLVSDVPFDQLRPATVEDIGGILSLIEPLEAAGALVKRSREKLEQEIERFVVMVRESTVVACGALYPYPEADMAEIACIAVHQDYQKAGFGHAVLDKLEQTAKKAGLNKTFALTTEAPQWFEERGFVRGDIDQLPLERQQLYNYQRNSIVMIKPH